MMSRVARRTQPGGDGNVLVAAGALDAGGRGPR